MSVAAALGRRRRTSPSVVFVVFLVGWNDLPADLAARVMRRLDAQVRLLVAEELLARLRDGERHLGGIRMSMKVLGHRQREQQVARLPGERRTTDLEAARLAAQPLPVDLQL